jgi:hypothetical protein
MPAKPVFEYAVVRVVPKVEREEFLNVGIILFCKELRFLDMVFELDAVRLQALSPTADAEELQANLASYEKIAKGNRDAGPIAQLDVASRFRWLTATRSTQIQSSKVHPGLCAGDPMETLMKLFEKLVRIGS